MLLSEVEAGKYYWCESHHVLVESILPFEAHATNPILVTFLDSSATVYKAPGDLSEVVPLTPSEKYDVRLLEEEALIRREIDADAYLSPRGKYRLAAEVMADGAISISEFESGDYKESVSLPAEEVENLANWLLEHRKSGA